MPSRSLVSIFCLNFPPEPTGIAPYTGGLAAGLKRSGYRIAVHTAHPHYPAWSISDGYGQWTRVEDIAGVNISRYLHYVPSSPRGVKRLLSEVSFGLRLVFSRWHRPGIIISVSPSLIASAFVLIRNRLSPYRCPIIIWVQDIYTLGLAETRQGGASVARILRWIESRTFHAADHIAVIHPKFRDYISTEFDVPIDTIHVMRNWTHLSAAITRESRSAKIALNWPQNAILAVHTGNMGVKQGLDNIVQAARIADRLGAPVHFFLVGDGSERLRLLESSKGIARLTFVGSLNDDDYALALAAADVLVVNEMPGVATMAVPSKLTSYLHAGRPIVAATDPAGITAFEVEAAAAGIVVKSGKPEELLEAVLSIGSSQQMRTQFSSNGRRYRDKYLEERSAISNWARLVASLLTSTKYGD